MELQSLPLSEIYVYENNPRRNDSAVEAVTESIRQCGYITPIIVDENHVILTGHTRYKALMKLGEQRADVLVKTGLSEEQKRKYRLLDNKTAEMAGWDFEKLADELEGLDFEDFPFDWGLSDQNYIGALETEDFVDWNKEDKKQFSISLTFDISDQELINGFVKEKGKEYISELIKKEAQSYANVG